MKRKPTNSEYENNLVKNAVIRLYESQQRFKQIEAAYKEEKESLQNSIKGYMGHNGFSSFNFVATNGCFAADNKKLNVREVVRKSVKFNIEKLERRLSKDILSQVVLKEYKINDMPGLVSYLKSCGVDPKVFRKFIDVEKEVDQKKLDQLGNLGKIEQKDIEGCFEIIPSEGYIRIDIAELEKDA